MGRRKHSSTFVGTFEVNSACHRLHMPNMSPRRFGDDAVDLNCTKKEGHGSEEEFSLGWSRLVGCKGQAADGVGYHLVHGA